MGKLHPGDIITIQQEKIASDYARSRDFFSVVIETQETDEGFGDLLKLSKRNLFRVVKNDIHEDLAKLGVKVHHYTLQSENIESFVFKANDEVLLNGAHMISLTKANVSKLSEAIFLNERQANAIANSLNAEELKKLKELEESVAKALVFLDSVVKRELV
jgi:hypothetical protein